MATLVQQQYTPYPVEEQVVLLHMAVNRMLLEVPVSLVREFNADYLNYARAMHPDILASIAETGDITQEQMDTLKETAAGFRSQYLAKLAPEEEVEA